MSTKSSSSGISIWQLVALLFLWCFVLATLDTMIDGAVALKMTMDDMWRFVLLIFGANTFMSVVILLGPKLAQYLDRLASQRASTEAMVSPNENGFLVKRGDGELPPGYDKCCTEPFGQHYINRN